MTTLASVPFPMGPSRVQPLATAPLNDIPSASTQHYRTRPIETRKRSETTHTASQQMRPQQYTRSQTGLQRRLHNNESRQREDKSSGSASTIESDVRPTTTEFPSYESFQKLQDGKKTRDDGPLRRPYPFRRTTSGDSSDEGDSDRENVPYARRSILDRPRPRSTHFVDFDDAKLSFQRREDVDNRLRRQSTRRSLELGRFRIQDKDDKVVAGITITTPSGTDSDNGRREPATAFDGRGSNIRIREDQGEISRQRGMIARRGSEMLMRSRDDVIEAKVVLLGSQGVGKTCLAKRYTEGVFSAQPATVNASLFTRKSVHDGVAVRLQIWDTCGEEKHRSLTKLYYRGAHVALILYDITDLKSFEDVRDWITELRNVSDETDIFVVGAKYDLAKAGKRKVDRRYARWKLATWLGVDTRENLQYLSGLVADTPAATPRSERLPPFEFPSTPTGIHKTTSALPLLSPRPLPPTKPGAYRFLSLLNISSAKAATSAVLDDDDTDALASSITLHPGSRIQSGQRSNSTSAASLMAMPIQGSTSHHHTPSHKLPTSGSTSGLNLMSATSIAPRRKSEDWSMNKAKDEFLRALGSANSQESEATKALKRTSGELLRPYSANPALDRGPVGGHVADYAIDDDCGWGKLIVGTSVRIGETSAKTGKGITEVFASLTSQLVAKRQQIRVEQARRAREVVDITNNEQNVKASTSKGRTGANCCT